MGLLVSFNAENVLRYNCGMEGKSIAAMKNSIRIYWVKRKNDIARSRIKSAVSVIRNIEGKVNE